MKDVQKILIFLCIFCRQEIEEMEERYQEQEREWCKQQDQLEQQLQTKEQLLSDLQDKVQAIRQTVELLLLFLITLIYSAILCSQADSLCSHVILQ